MIEKGERPSITKDKVGMASHSGLALWLGNQLKKSYELHVALRI